MSISCRTIYDRKSIWKESWPFVGSFVKRKGTKISYYWGLATALLGYGGILFADNIWTAAASYVMIVFTVNYLRTMMAPMGALIIDND